MSSETFLLRASSLLRRVDPPHQLRPHPSKVKGVGKLIVHERPGGQKATPRSQVCVHVCVCACVLGGVFGLK